MNPIQPNRLDGGRGPEDSGRVRKSGKSDHASHGKGGASRHDSVEFSADPAALEAKAKELTDKIHEFEEVRTDRIERAMALINSGEIDSKEYYEKAAEAMLDQADRLGGL